MIKLSDLINRNKIYTTLLIFVILINVFIFIGWMSSKGTDATSVGVETKIEQKTSLFDEEDIKMRQEKIKTLYYNDPVLYVFIVFLNLFILFVLFLGILLDAVLLYGRIRKKPLNIPKVKYESPRWSVTDVFRVILIFLSCGYTFVIIEGFIFSIFPIINNRNMEMILNTALMNIVGISVIFYFVRKKYGQSLEVVGISAKNVLSNIFYAVCGYIALLPVLAAIMILIFFIVKLTGYQPPAQPIVEILIKEKGTGVLWVSTVFAGIFGPIAEEIFFRGFMYGAIKERLGVLWAVMITAVIFSVLHAHLVGLIPILVLGILLAYIFEKTGSLVAPVTVHILHNMGMVVLAFTARSLS